MERSLDAGDRFGEALARFVADGVADEAVGRRRRERWMASQLHESASLAGTLVDLAERAVPVAVSVRSGRRYRGVVRFVGTDVVVLTTDQGATALVATGALSGVRIPAGLRDTAGDRDVEVHAGMHQALALLVGERPRVTAVATGGDVWVGELRTVGADVVTIRLEGDGARIALPLAALDEVVIDDRELPDLLG